MKTERTTDVTSVEKSRRGSQFAIVIWRREACEAVADRQTAAAKFFCFQTKNHDDARVPAQWQAIAATEFGTQLIEEQRSFHLIANVGQDSDI